MFIKFSTERVMLKVRMYTVTLLLYAIQQQTATTHVYNRNPIAPQPPMQVCYCQQKQKNTNFKTVSCFAKAVAMYL